MKPLIKIGGASQERSRTYILRVVARLDQWYKPTMYAVSIGSSIYHLMQPRLNVTVCGLKVRPIRVKLRTGLTSTPTQPLDKLVCKHCVRLTQPR